MANGKYISTHGIFLSKHLHRDEKAVYITALTADIGKVNIIVRGVRKDFHKWGASFEPLEGGEMILYPVGDRYVLTSLQVDTIPRKEIRKHPTLRMAISLIIDKSVMQGNDSYPEWDVVVSFLHSTIPGKTLIAKFLLEYIGVLGYRVFMSGASCGICGKRYNSGEEWYYTPYEGYLVCKECSIIHGEKLGVYTVSPDIIKEVIRLKKIPWTYTEDFVSENTYKMILDRVFATVPVSDNVKRALYSLRR